MMSRLESIELLIAKFLRYGVILAGIVIFIGWALQIDFAHNVYAGFATYAQDDLLQRLSGAWVNRDWAILISYLGLTILISLPFIRVMLTAVVFIFDKDHLMASCALLVIFGLILSVTLGFQI